MHTLGKPHGENEKIKKEKETSKLCLLIQASPSCPSSAMTPQNESSSTPPKSVEYF